MRSPVNRRGLLGSVATMVALLAAKPVEAGRGRRGKGRRGKGKQDHEEDENESLLSCQAQCQEAFEGCANPCGGETFCLGNCQSRQDRCNAECPHD
jgi:hypothetical protein